MSLVARTKKSTQMSDDDLDGEYAACVAKLFKAVADPIRVQLVSLVRQSPSAEACFCDLAEEFDMPQPTLSHHLRVLVDAGVLSRERRGTWSWYTIQPEPLAIMEQLLRPGGPLRDASVIRVGREPVCD